MKWTSVQVPAGEIPMLAKVLAPVGAPGLMFARPSVAPAATTSVEVPLPDLPKDMPPMKRAQVLLRAAAEIEHVLCVQYLYAYYSLVPPTEAPPDLAPAVRSWGAHFREIAFEEMGHLLSVQNLLAFLRLEPHFDRAPLPSENPFYPFPAELAPLSRRSLARYVLAEAPWVDRPVQFVVEAGINVQPVGILYGLLAVVLGDPAADPDAAPPDGDPWSAFVRDVAIAAFKQARPAQWIVDGEHFHPGSIVRQGKPEHFGRVGEVIIGTVQSGHDARAMVRRIGLQGEAPVEIDGTPSHYQRFRWIADGHDGVIPFSDAVAAAVVRPVPRNPQRKTYQGEAADAAERFDKAYGGLLRTLLEYVRSDKDASKRELAARSLEHMYAMKTEARTMTELPVHPGAEVVAGPVFTLPRRGGK